MSRIVKSFLHVFLNSLIPNAPYYSKILKTKFSFSLKYIVSLILILNLVFIAVFSLRFNPGKIGSIFDRLVLTLDKFPSDLTISLRKGTLKTNYNRPYFLWLDYQNKKKLILVIDESASPQKIDIYTSILLLTTRELVINNKKYNQTSTIIPLAYFGNQTINKQNIALIAERLVTLRKLLPIILIAILALLIIIIPISSVLITGFYLLLINIVVYGLTKLFIIKKAHFKKTLQISFHAATFPLVLDYFLIAFQPALKLGRNPPNVLQQIPFPLLFLILLTVFAFAGVYEAHRNDGKK